MKIKVILLCVLILFTYHFNQACDAFTSFCSSSAHVNNEKIVVGTITNSFANSVEFNIIDVLYGQVNNNSITIWDGTTFECNGPWPNDANDMGNINDTILCIIEPITSIQNPWDVIGAYRRPSVFAGNTYTNFSIGSLFENTYNFSDVLPLDFANYCCEDLNQSFNFYFGDLPDSTGSSSPIALTGYPAGGTFSGPGIVFNAFNPPIAGPGNHTITYTIDDEFGCSFSTQESILVFTITYNFVNYNLGTINPKINNQLNLEVDLPEPDLYTFKIFDLVGKQWYHYAAQLKASVHSQNILLNKNLANGIYFLSISNSHTMVTQKFMVSK